MLLTTVSTPRPAGVPWRYKNAPEQSATLYPELETVLILSGTGLQGAPLTRRVRASDAPGTAPSASRSVPAPSCRFYESEVWERDFRQESVRCGRPSRRFPAGSRPFWRVNRPPPSPGPRAVPPRCVPPPRRPHRRPRPQHEAPPPAARRCVPASRRPGDPVAGPAPGRAVLPTCVPPPQRPHRRPRPQHETPALGCAAR